MPPLDDTGTDLQVSPDLKRSAQELGSGQVAKPMDRSGALAQSLADRLPQAIAAEEQQEQEKKGLAQKSAGEMERTAKERSLLQAPVPPMPTMPPQRQQTDPWMAWGSPAMAFAMLASAFTRRPAINAMNAAAGVMNAYHAGDEQAYKDQYQHWKDQTEYAHQLYEYQRDAYADAMEKLDKDEKTSLARLKVLASALSDEPLKRLLDVGNVAGAIDLQRQRDTADREAKARLPGIEADAEMKQQTLAAKQEVLSANQALQANPNDADAKARLQRATETLKILETGKVSAAEEKFQQDKELGDRAVAEWKRDHPGQALTAQQETEVRRGASVTGAARPRSAPAIYLQKYMEEHPEATSTEIATAAAEYQRAGAIERAFAGGVIGRNLMSLNTVAGHILSVQEYADALKNGQIPRANQIANRIAVEEGKPEVTSFEAARDIMADEVVRLLTSTGGTEADRQGMQSRLSSMMSPQQMAGVFDVFKNMTGERFEAMRQQYAGNDPARQAHFDNELLTPNARKVFGALTGKGETAPSAAPARPAGVPEGSAYSASRGMWRSPDGKFFDKTGKPVPAPANP